MKLSIILSPGRLCHHPILQGKCMKEPVWRPTWQQDAVEIKSNNYEYRGFYSVQKFELRHRCFSGEWSPWLPREQLKHSDASAVLLIDPKLQKLILVEQFRVGLVNRAKVSPWLLEVVAGLIEPNETPLDTIMREAKEEANCDIMASMPIGEYYNSPGGFAEKTFLYCAIVDANNKAGVQGMTEEHEDILVHVLNIDEVLTAFSQGALITSSSTIIALQWLSANLQHPFLTKT